MTQLRFELLWIGDVQGRAEHSIAVGRGPQLARVTDPPDMAVRSCDR